MANGARAEGIEANLFFTFFGLDAIHKARHEHIKVATVRQPGAAPRDDGGRIAGSLVGHDALPGKEMEKLDIPPIPEFIEMISDTVPASTAARHRWICSSSPRTISSTRSPTIITVGEFYAMAAGRPDHLHLDSAQSLRCRTVATAETRHA